ncbi:flagellar motor switch protein FliG [Treponema zioleckii]|uniref:flagellar motor switch protein FliG n=1 Tax=Treponema zioleckii TaxID=331680 RepID=UPI001F5BA503|nr:flagellar motor switch protein FliG [Treponema zioleckii]
METQSAVDTLTSGGLIMVPKKPNDADGRENVYRRVAKFLLLIGVDEAAKIMPHLSEEQTEKIIPEIASIKKVDADEAEEILAEFNGLLEKAREGGGIDTARTILQKAFGTVKAERILDESVTFQQGKPFEFLYEADADKVSTLLKDESNAVKALVLTYLKPKISAGVIQKLSDADKKDVVVRLAKMRNVNPDVLKNVDYAMHQKMNKMAIQKSDSIDGKSTLAQILKRMSPSAEEGILNQLSEQDPNLGSDLRELLFTTEDIINGSDRYLQTYLRGMKDDDIALLICGKKDDFRGKILKNVSSNRAASILELEEIKKPILRADVEKVTSAFFTALRRAYDSGDFIINGRDGEIYV